MQSHIWLFVKSSTLSAENSDAPRIQSCGGTSPSLNFAMQPEAAKPAMFSSQLNISTGPQCFSTISVIVPASGSSGFSLKSMRTMNGAPGKSFLSFKSCLNDFSIFAPSYLNLKPSEKLKCVDTQPSSGASSPFFSII